MSNNKVKCPKCGAEIDSLDDYSMCVQRFVFTVGSDGLGDYVDVGDSVSADEPDDYKCPECGEVLFTDEEKALAFLKGEVKPN